MMHFHLPLFGKKPKGYDWRKADPKWAALLDAHLREHNHCAAQSPQCRGHLTPHHIKPHWLFPQLYYDPNNLMTLCQYHHLKVGHGGDWCGWVPEVRRRAEECKMLRWTHADLLLRCRRERSYVVEGCAGPGGAKLPPLPIVNGSVRVPAGGVTSAWWRRLKAAVLGGVLLGVLGCKGGPGIRVTVSLTPLPVVTVQVGGGDLAAPTPLSDGAQPPPDPDARKDGTPKEPTDGPE